MKILVTGAAGMLGSGLVPELVRGGHDLVATDIDLSEPTPWGRRGPTLSHLDVRAAEQVRAAVSEVAPDLVVHLAAETSLERCEDDPDHAWLTNAVGTKHVALTCGRAELPLVYISTAGVFDGTKADAYVEYDEPNPLNLYGASKLEGEGYVRWFSDQAYIIRAGWMVGGGRKDHKFVAKIANQLRAGRRTIRAVGDKLGTPTYVPDFARCFVNLLGTESYGLYHMACEGEGSRYDVALEMLEVLGIADEIELIEVGSEVFADEFYATRPRSEIMRNLVLDLQGLNLMRPWRVALREYLLRHFADLAAPGVLDVAGVIDMTERPAAAAV